MFPTIAGIIDAHQHTQLSSIKMGSSELSYPLTPDWSGTAIFPTSVFSQLEVTGVCHHHQLLIEMGSQELYAHASPKLWSSQSQPPKQLKDL
jgi:hypothetical protein